MKARTLVAIVGLLSAAPAGASLIVPSFRPSFQQDISLLLYVDAETHAFDVVGIGSGFSSWLAWRETQDALGGALGLSPVPRATLLGVADDGYWMALTWRWTRFDSSWLNVPPTTYAPHAGTMFSAHASVNVVPEPAVGLLVALGLTLLAARRSRR